jgi:hypothetical protein
VGDDNQVIGMITRKDLLYDFCESKHHEHLRETPE